MSSSDQSSEEGEDPYTVQDDSSSDEGDLCPIDLSRSPEPINKNTSSSSSSTSSSSTSASSSSIDETKRKQLLIQRKQIQSDIRQLQNTLDSQNRALAKVDNLLLLLPPSNSCDWTTTTLNQTLEAQIKNVMQGIWRLAPNFRPFQLEAIRATLSQKSVLLVMPTGGGKSLAFQLPAVIENINKQQFTVVVSPLCSLSEDQVYGLKEKNINAKVLASYTSKEEVKEIYDLMMNPPTNGTPTLTLLYVTPEKITKSKTLQSKLTRCARQHRIGRFVIDECHCVSSWGNDFRPAYRQLHILRTSDFLKDVPMMLLTATATKEVRADIRRVLNYESGNALECFIGSFNRTNLLYKVKTKPDSIKLQLEAVATDINANHTMQESGIIYVTSRKDCQVVAEGLSKEGISAISYHAGLSDDQRQNAHRRWRSNNIRVICATIAFGMGIDKPDVRFVHHFCLPKSLENYLQESGRAGRDGNQARCVLWYKRKDMFRVSPMVHESNSKALPQLHTFVSGFCEATDVCRRSVLANAFGEGNEFVPEKHCNQMCDVCLKDVTVHVSVNCTTIALYVLDVLIVLKEEAIKMDITFSQLVDAARGVGTSWKSISTNTSKKSSIESLKGAAKRIPSMKKMEWEALTMAMLLQGFLIEGFVSTAYSFTSYMRVNLNARENLIRGDRVFIMQQEKKEEKKEKNKKKGGKKKKVSASSSSSSSSSSSLIPKVVASKKSNVGEKRKRKPPVVVIIDSSDEDDFD